MLTYYSIGFVKNSEEAEDIVQDTFIKLWINKNNLTNISIKSWLYTCVKNSSINFLKRHRNKIRMPDGFSDTCIIANDNIDNFDLKLHLNRELNKLSSKNKELILLRDRDGLTYEEIGIKLNLTDHQVKSYLFRARKILKESCKKLMTEINY
tara:strand:- start:85 stop:540 length:456 start_codon:yes stop_codon:yes gene_type:complete